MFQRRPKVKIEPIETPRLILRGFTKEDALWAYSIWNDPEMGEYLPDEAKQEVAPCGGRIVAEKAYKKRGTDVIMEEYLYEVSL